MGLPFIDIKFKEVGSTAISRGQRGIVVLILRDTVPATNSIEMFTPADIPETLSAKSKEQIQLAFRGYINPPRKIIAYIIDEETVDYAAAQNYLETIKWDYVAVPEIEVLEVDDFANWIKTLRSNKMKRVKAVLPNCNADNEGIINFATDNIVTKTKIYKTAEYCSRIAGLIAGTPMTIASTFAPLPEVMDIDKLTKEQYDAAIVAGKFVLYNDGEKVKVARGVNSFVTTTQDKLDSFKKIKIVETMDMIFDDIKKTAEDSYLGKYSNSYDNKCLLIVAIGAYFDQLEMDGILDRGKSYIGVDIDAQKIYLKSIDYITTDGKGPDEMTEQEIKEANTKDKVFLTSNVKILDAIEEITLPIII